MAFSDVGCQPSTDTSLATDQVLSEITNIKTSAGQNLAVAVAAAMELKDYSPEQARYNPSFSGAGQLGQWEGAGKPLLDLDALLFADQDAPGDDVTQEITDTNTHTYLPPLDSSLITYLISVLCDIIENGFQGLPLCYESLRWYKARDQFDREGDKQAVDVVRQYAGRGWAQPCGPEIAAIDMIREDVARKLADESRDIAFKVYDTAIEIFILALNSAMEYFSAWSKIYDAWLDAQSELGEFQLIKGKQELERLRGLIQLFSERVANERSRIDTTVNIYNGEIGAYRATIEQSGHASRSLQTSFERETSSRQLEAQKDQQHDRADANALRVEIIEAVNTLRELLNSYGRSVTAQFQGMGFSAGIGSSVNSSNSKSCDTSYSYRETQES